MGYSVIFLTDCAFLYNVDTLNNPKTDSRHFDRAAPSV